MAPSSNPTYLYWDASVFIAWLQNEPNRADKIKQHLDEFPQDGLMLVASAVSIVEVAFTAQERVSEANISPQNVALIEGVWQDPRILLVEASAPILRSARNLIRSFKANHVKLTPLDAIHLATALWVDKYIHPIEAVETFDRRWIDHQALIGLRVQEPHPNQYRLLP